MKDARLTLFTAATVTVMLGAAAVVGFATDGPKMVVPKMLQDMGKVAQGEVLEVDFAIVNEGDETLEIKAVRPAHAQSVERLFHLSEVPALYLPLGQGSDEELRVALMTPRLERAIGVIYRPETELASHYFETVLPKQFDEYIWFDRTSAVTPIDLVVDFRS